MCAQSSPDAKQIVPLYCWNKWYDTQAVFHRRRTKITSNIVRSPRALYMRCRHVPLLTNIAARHLGALNILFFFSFYQSHGTLHHTRSACFPHGKVEHKARFILDPALYSER